MSLLVWLPLLGNLNNQGVHAGKIENMGAVSSNSSGKIGSCMSFNGTGTSNIRLPPILKNTDDMSFACWVKFNNTNNQCLFSQRVNTNTLGFTIFYLNSTEIRFDDGDALTASSSVSANTWYHIVCCRDATKKYIYINGVLKATGTRTSTIASNVNSNYAFIGGSQNNTAGTPVQTNANMLNGYLNDVRIYNHCLSTAEVHEISQGLVLHYKLDGFQGGYGNPNLITNFDTSFLSYADGATTLFTNQMNSGTQEIVSNFNGAHKCLHLHSSGGSNRQYRTIGLAAGKTYTISADYYSTTTQATAWRGELNGGDYSWTGASGGTYDTPGVWKRMSYTYSNLTSNATLYFFTYCTNGTDCYIKDIKIEYGSSATVWGPPDSPTTTIQDSSGYGHNGIHAGNGTLISDTPRYTSAFSFNGAINNRIYCNDTAMNFTDNFSFATWMRANYTGTTAQFLFTVGRADAGGYGYGLQNSADSTVRVRFGNLAYDITITKNTWTHIAFTKSGTTLKTYKNGTLVNTYTFSGTLPTYSDGKGLGIGCFHYASGDIYPSYGAMSDFRIYATPLSADDIKQLYELGAKVDNKGNLHCYELKEYSALLKFHKNGIVQHKVLHETGLLNNITSFSYKPAANTNNSCTNGAILDFTAFANEGQSVTFSIEYDVSWSGLAAGTGGTFRTLIQGSNRLKSNNSWAWQGSNYFTGFNFTSSVTSNATGSVHKTATVTIPASWFDTYNGSYFGFRTDYANGTGTVSISNLKVTVQSNIFKLKKSSIMTNNLIEF